MPLLQFETTLELTPAQKTDFADTVRELYSEVMQTGTSHAAVVVRERSPAELSLGRETDDDRLLFLDADIREGRSADRKRTFARAVMDLAADEFGVPTPNMKVVFTEHEGPSMMGYDRVGSDWSPEEGDGT
ncbi:tautomerase family protein [Haloparvum sp. AD34]